MEIKWFVTIMILFLFSIGMVRAEKVCNGNACIEVTKISQFEVIIRNLLRPFAVSPNPLTIPNIITWSKGFTIGCNDCNSFGINHCDWSCSFYSPEGLESYVYTTSCCDCSVWASCSYPIDVFHPTGSWHVNYEGMLHGTFCTEGAGTEYFTVQSQVTTTTTVSGTTTTMISPTTTTTIQGTTTTISSTCKKADELSQRSTFTFWNSNIKKEDSSCCSGYTFCQWQYVNIGGINMFTGVMECKCTAEKPTRTTPVYASCDEVKVKYPYQNIQGTCTKEDLQKTDCLNNWRVQCNAYEEGIAEGLGSYCWTGTIQCTNGCYKDINNIPQCKEGQVTPQPVDVCLADSNNCYHMGVCYHSGDLVKDLCSDNNLRAYCENGHFVDKYDCGVECTSYKTAFECTSNKCIWFNNACTKCVPIGTLLANDYDSCKAKDANICCPFVEEGYSLRRIMASYGDYPRVPFTQHVDTTCYCVGKCWETTNLDGDTIKLCEGLPETIIQNATKGTQKAENLVEKSIKDLLGGVSTGLGLDAFTKQYCIFGVCFTAIIWIIIIIVIVIVLSFIRK